MNVLQWNHTVARCWEGSVGQPCDELVCGPVSASAGNAEQWVVEWRRALAACVRGELTVRPAVVMVGRGSHS